jgi:putative ABC transport system permease protein
VISYSVGQRSREIGVRIALGADSARVVRMVLKEGGALVACGLALGVVGAVASTRLLSAFLFGVSPTDPPTIAGGVLLLVATACAATYIPARRAGRMDPLAAIRAE